MCGIVGYTGTESACGLILRALENLEYRGYDSAGLALFGEHGVEVIKRRGRLDCLRAVIEAEKPVSVCGMGHTRWATHGEPSDINSHPHRSGRVTLVHNGIVENYHELKTALAADGYAFASATDTEVAAALLDSLYTGEPLVALKAARQRLEGSYAFVVMFDDRPDELYAMRNASPLVAAQCGHGCFFASDMPALLEHTRDYYLLDEGELVRATPAGVEFYDAATLLPRKKAALHAGWTVEQARKGGYKYFMLKEIDEQPQALRDTIEPRLRDGLPHLTGDGIPEGFFKGVKRIRVAACGTAMYSGMVGRALIEQYARIPVEVDVASELRYRNPIFGENEVAVIISQSGETADSLAALRLFKERGLPVIAVVNVVGSSIAREADYCIYTHAGPEIAVASTKAYSVQVSVMYLLAIAIAGENGLAVERQREAVAGLWRAVEAVKAVLADKERFADYARGLIDVEHLFFIGRGLDYSLAMEGSLKLKEISYIHSEAYAAGELKHGTISLITEGVPVIALATQTQLLHKTLDNVQEVKARGARVLIIAAEGVALDIDACDSVIRLPALEPFFMPLPVVAALQLIAANAAMLRGCDVDKPRNLAKSVTVE